MLRRELPVDLAQEHARVVGALDGAVLVRAAERREESTTRGSMRAGSVCLVESPSW